MFLLVWKYIISFVNESVLFTGGDSRAAEEQFKTYSWSGDSYPIQSAMAGSSFTVGTTAKETRQPVI